MLIARKNFNNFLNKKIYPEINLKAEDFNDPYLKDLKELCYEIEFLEDKISVKIAGIMICPCAITCEDVENRFEISEFLSLSKNDDFDYYIENDLDTDEIALFLIKQEVPFQVVKKGKIVYPRGDGWKILSEQEFLKQQQNQTNSCFKKMLELNIDEEE